MDGKVPNRGGEDEQDGYADDLMETEGYQEYGEEDALDPYAARFDFNSFGLFANGARRQARHYWDEDNNN